MPPSMCAADIIILQFPNTYNDIVQQLIIGMRVLNFRFSRRQHKCNRVAMINVYNYRPSTTFHRAASETCVQ